MSLDFDFFYSWVKSNLHMDLNAYKENQLQRRITTVMKNSGASDLKEYAKLISQDAEIKNIFLDYITINVTEFFRNKEIFKQYESVLKDILIPRFKNINIWSAACSIGAEPYSIAIILDKYNVSKGNKILATDIDHNVLKKAQVGAFYDHQLKNVSSEDLAYYFKPQDKQYIIDEKIKKMVTFKKHDLILDSYEKNLHSVVCRNVTIYFKNEAKDEIYAKISNSLVSGGVLFTGATESIYNPKGVGLRKLSTFIYEKI